MREIPDEPTKLVLDELDPLDLVACTARGGTVQSSGVGDQIGPHVRHRPLGAIRRSCGALVRLSSRLELTLTSLPLFSLSACSALVPCPHLLTARHPT